MKIALIQTNPVIGDFTGNTARMIKLVAKARDQGCDLAIFPELALSGYPPRDLLERREFIAAQNEALITLVKKTAGISIICGAALKNKGKIGKPLYNGALIIDNGRISGAAVKRLLPSYDVFDESRYFEAGRSSSIIRFKGLRLGITICEDIWNDKNAVDCLYHADPVAEMMADPDGSPDILINIAASPFRLGKAAIKKNIFKKLCRRHDLPLLYVNQAGGQDALVFDGRSLAMNRDGEVFALADAFTEDILIVDSEDTETSEDRPEYPESDEDAMVFTALTCGTRDYVRKCGFKKIVLGLSGGIDSAVCAVIATMALGSDNVMAMAMPSRYSAPESTADAEKLSERLGFKISKTPIDGLMAVFSASLGPILGKFEGSPTEQNLQARLRGMLLMAVANHQGRILLTTGNKSEMAVGYCTLYGDMNGGLAVLSDVPKHMVYRLAGYINREEEIIPSRIIRRPPSAELAPDQRDDDDLPPYDELDPILTAWVEENRSLEEIIAAGHDPDTAAGVIDRIMSNEHKRAQAAPGIKITSKAFGYGRRYPIAQGYREKIGRDKPEGMTNPGRKR